MKILQINAVYQYSSTGRNVSDAHRYFQQQGQESYVAWATKNTSGETDPHVFRIGNTLDHKLHAALDRLSGKQGYWSKQATKELCEKIAAIEPDVVHLHNLHNNYIHFPMLMTFLAEKKIPTVITLHDCWFFTGGCCYLTQRDCSHCEATCNHCEEEKRLPFIKRNVNNLLEERIELFSALPKLAVVGVSNWITEVAKNSFLGKADIIKCIYNWIDQDLFCPGDSIALRARLGLEPEQKVILGISTGWSPKKGLTELCDMARRFPKATVILVGKQKQKTELPSNVISYGFTQNVQELVALYRMADVFVNPSHTETFGKVTAEALSCGTPAVVFRNTGCTEMVPPGTGLVAENEDVQDLLAKTEKVLLDGKGTYETACRQWAEKAFRLQDRLQEHLDLYKELIEK